MRKNSQTIPHHQHFADFDRSVVRPSLPKPYAYPGGKWSGLQESLIFPPLSRVSPETVRLRLMEMIATLTCGACLVVLLVRTLAGTGSAG